MLVTGSYSFLTPEGELVEMQYTADENGYHASGSHMPTTPPPPPHVQRLLDHLAKAGVDSFTETVQDYLSLSNCLKFQ